MELKTLVCTVIVSVPSPPSIDSDVTELCAKLQLLVLSATVRVPLVVDAVMVVPVPSPVNVNAAAPLHVEVSIRRSSIASMKNGTRPRTLLATARAAGAKINCR